MPTNEELMIEIANRIAARKEAEAEARAKADKIKPIPTSQDNSEMVQPVNPNPIINHPANVNPSEYILLEAKTYPNSYSYPDTGIAMQRSNCGLKWPDTHKALNQKNLYMPTIRQWVDFLSLLKSGNAFDANGKKLPKSKLDSILDEILTVREPWRGEWLDADFKVVNNQLQINYGHYTDSNGILVPAYKEQLEDCLMSDKTPGIDIDEWLKNANNQGLPKTNVKNGSLWYWFPRSDNISVARFNVDSDWAYLNCGRDPRGSDASLGVFASYRR